MDDATLIEEITLRGFLSFAPDSEPVKLRALNVLIGANGSGKSNFLEAFEVLRAAPKEISRPIERAGGIEAWLWRDTKGTEASELSVDALVRGPLRYRAVLEDQGFRLSCRERIEEPGPRGGAKNKKPYVFFGRDGTRWKIRRSGEERLRLVRPSSIDVDRSILAQRQDPDLYPEISRLASTFGKIGSYRSWSFGRHAPGRERQRTDLPTKALSGEWDNLVLVLARLWGIPRVKRTLLDRLKQLYAPIDALHFELGKGSAQLFFLEGERVIPAVRLSDGTLRYLALLAILCDPKPPPLILLEEPELGLHPDVLPTIADLLVEASTRTQLIVTTHSEIIVDCYTETPEHILVCERDEHGTKLRRLDQKKLAVWLKDYRLGKLWSSGDIGGNRW